MVGYLSVATGFNWENLQTLKIELKIWPLSFLGAKKSSFVQLFMDIVTRIRTW